MLRNKVDQKIEGRRAKVLADKGMVGSLELQDPSKYVRAVLVGLLREAGLSSGTTPREDRHVPLGQGHDSVMWTSVTLALISAVLVAGCTESANEAVSPTPTAFPSAKSTPSAVPVTDLDSFVQALEIVGYDVRLTDEQQDPLFPVWPPARYVCIGAVRVHAFEFPDEAAADDVRSEITSDGYGIPTGGEALAHVDWIGPPHFFAGGRLIVLYLPYWRHDRQDEKHTLEALELILGRQFAGSDEGGRSTEPGFGPAHDACIGA